MADFRQTGSSNKHKPHNNKCGITNNKCGITVTYVVRILAIYLAIIHTYVCMYYIDTIFSEETYAADDVDDHYYNEDGTHCSNYYAYAESTMITNTITITCTNTKGCTYY